MLFFLLKTYLIGSVLKYDIENAILRGRNICFMILNFDFRAHRDYWEKLNPSTGRPFSAALSKPDAWGVTKGDDILKQQTESTTEEEIAKLRAAH